MKPTFTNNTFRAAWCGATLLAAMLGCAEEASYVPETDDAVAHAEDGSRGYIGVKNLAQGDTLVSHAGMTIVERIVAFPTAADGAEVYAWEFFAESFEPVKLLVVRLADSQIELVGESPMTIPANKGVNYFELPEPIPVRSGDRIGFLQPEGGTIPLLVVHNWKTLITSTPFERPYMYRSKFSVYGWRYSFRAHWRRAEDAES